MQKKKTEKGQINVDIIIDYKTNILHTFKSMWLKTIASTLLQISALQVHLQGEQIILMNTTEF
jgi:hypothetical protein